MKKIRNYIWDYLVIALSCLLYAVTFQWFFDTNNLAMGGFTGIVQVLNHYSDTHSSSGHLYLARLLGKTVEERNEVISKMAERGIACNVHYKPLPMMTAYKNLGFDIADYPNAYAQYENEVTLPLHTRLTDEDVEYVISNFVDIINNI